jgi:tape measure domain-containing protein
MAGRSVTFSLLARDLASRTLDKVGSGFHKLGKTAGSLGKTAALGAAGGIAALGTLGVVAVKTGLSTAAAMQQASIGFETLLGSAQKSKVFVSDLSKFAANTPFEFPGLVDSSRTLLGVGVAANKVIPMLTDFGDAAGALAIEQAGFQRIMMATSQAISAGKFQAGDLNQIMNNGLPVWTLLSKAMHKSVPELRELASKGKLLSKDVLPALQAQMHKDYGGAMARQSKTLSGLWSTLKDTLSQGLAKALLPLIPTIQNALPKAITFLEKALTGLGKGLQWAMDAWSALKTAFTTGDTFGAPSDGMLKVQRVGVLARKGFDALSVAVKAVSRWFMGDLVPAVRSTWRSIHPLVSLVRDNLRAAFGAGSGSGTGFATTMKAVGQIVIIALRAIILVAAAVALSWSIQMRVMSAAIRNVLLPAVRAIWAVFSRQVSFILNGAARAFGWIPGIGPKLRAAAANFDRFAASVNRSLSGIKGRTVDVVVRYRTTKGPGGQVKRSQVRMRAAGGGLMLGSSYMVGEEGPELLTLRGGTGSVTPAAQTARQLRHAGGRGGDVYVTVNVAGSVIAERDLAKRVNESLQSLVRSGTYVGLKPA